jgi:transketolase
MRQDGLSMRDAYAEALIELAAEDPSIVALHADLSGADGTLAFDRRFPDRSFNVGVAEANMVGIAAGLSSRGKIPFADTFAVFASRRVFDQFFISANYARLNVKLVGSDPGITAQFNGGTHMSFEDIGIMRTVPGLVIFEPCDTVSLKALVKRAAYHPGCTYMRLHRKDANVIYADAETFELGRGKVLRDGSDVTIIAMGFVLVPEALKAAERLESDGISAAVIDMHTVKPVDRDLVLRCAAKTTSVVTLENHQIRGGLGSAVAELLAEAGSGRLERIGIEDEFGEVGLIPWLLERYRLSGEHVARRVREFLDKG